MQKNYEQKIVITGGGSGGHTMTSVAVISKLLEKYPLIKDKLVYIGGNLGMEGEESETSLDEKIFSDMNIDYIKIRSGKLQRSFSLRSILVLFGVIGGFIDAWKFFSKNRVSLVFSTGGYVSVPVCIVAGLKRIPVIIHEQTTRVGLSNKICSKFAKKILVGFEESRKYFSKDKVVFVGNPIRKSLKDSKYWPQSVSQKMRMFKRRSKDFPVLLVAGGGQGSHLLNEVVRQSLNQLLLDFQLILLTGDNKVNKDYVCLQKSVQKLSDEFKKRIIIEKFAKDEMGAYYDAADLYIGRGGAMSVYEVGYLGIPSLIIPIPWVTHNEQYHNAKVLEDLGLSMILNEGELSCEVFVQKIKKFNKRLQDGLIDFDKRALRQKFIPNGDQRIVEEIEEYL